MLEDLKHFPAFSTTYLAGTGGYSAELHPIVKEISKERPPHAAAMSPLGRSSLAVHAAKAASMIASLTACAERYSCRKSAETHNGDLPRAPVQPSRPIASACASLRPSCVRDSLRRRASAATEVTSVRMRPSAVTR